MKTFITISYDISDDKRRTKAAKALEDYGTRVQYSVFECRLQQPELQKLKNRLRPLIKLPTDSVRFYFLDADDVARIEVMGSGQVTPDKPYYMR
jgi:CRISPR-associated protein Cas2